VFSYGDARFYGTTGSLKLRAPIVGMTAASAGYWLLGRDGGLFSFGDAKFYGSIPALGWCPGPAALAMARTTTAKGYWVLLSDGRVVAFGDAKPYGQPATTNARAITLAAAP
jgi:hypothetical protein